MNTSVTTNIDKVVDIIRHSEGCYEPPIDHKFMDGIYYREMFVLKDTVLVGATHTKECYNILLSGEIMVGIGDDVRILKAPLTFVTSPGVQKVGYCLTDVLWANVFRTDAITVEEAEKELFKEEIYKEIKWQE